MKITSPDSNHDVFLSFFLKNKENIKKKRLLTKNVAVEVSGAVQLPDVSHSLTLLNAFPRIADGDAQQN